MLDCLSAIDHLHGGRLALRGIGAAEVLVKRPDLGAQLGGGRSGGVDAVLDIVGTGTVLDWLMAARRGGAVCLYRRLVDRVAGGAHQAKPLAVFSLEQVVEAHRLMESGDGGGKIVVRI